MYEVKEVKFKKYCIFRSHVSLLIISFLSRIISAELALCKVVCVDKFITEHNSWFKKGVIDLVKRHNAPKRHRWRRKTYMDILQLNVLCT